MNNKLLFLFAYFLLTSCASRFYDYKSDIAHQRKIVTAYFKFRDHEKAFPNDLKEIVEAGHLPEYGDFYLGYVGWEILPRNVSYIDSDYKIFNGSEGDQNKIIGIRSLSDPDVWEFRSDIIIYVMKKREKIE
jgi:hypothetical protein